MTYFPDNEPVTVEDLSEAIEWLRVNEGDAAGDDGVTEGRSCNRVADMLQREMYRRISRKKARQHD